MLFHAFCRSLFSALKHRYQETAEKQYEDPGARAPFSTWRRSGNFEDAATIAPEAQKEKSKSLERKTFHRESDKGSHYGSSYQEDNSRSGFKDSERSKSNLKETTALSEKQEEKSADELIFNFRQALRRHALSENEKAQEHERVTDSNVPKIDIEDDATAQRLERLRAARAKIHEQRQSDKVHSQSFATEFKIDKDKQEKPRSESASSVSSQKSGTDRVHSEEPVSKSEEQKHRSSTKLARQKLVSDDLRAKYMIKREDEKEKTPTPSEDSLSRKRSDRKERLKEHKEFWSKEKEQVKDTSTTKGKSESENVPSMEEMLLGSSRSSKSSVSKKFENVDHSSPFGSVYSKPSTVVTTTSSPVSAAAPTITTLTSTYHTQPEKIEKLKSDSVGNKISVKSNEKNIPQESRTEALGKKDKKYKKYAKAKSLELGALSKQEKTEPVTLVETKDDSNVNDMSSEETSQLSRFERIAKYKEERRRQLKSLQEKFGAGDSSELPSLFLSSKPASEDTSISRSKSLKVESDNKSDIAGSAVSRSKSLKQEKETESYGRSSPAFSEMHKMPGLRLAEIGTQAKSREERDVYDSNDEKYKTDKIIDKIHSLKKLKEDQGKRAGQEEMHNVRYSKEFQGDGDLDKHVSYASKALLADRIMESTQQDRMGISGTRERVQSSSSERDVVKTDKTVFGKPSSAKDTEQKSYFEFGTVFTKKEPKIEKPQERSVNLEVRSEEDRDYDSGRDSVDSYSRVRRKLPSVEDVLGTATDDKVEKLDKHRDTGKEKKTESKILVKKEVTKEEISSMTGEEIGRRKVAENIEKAKFKFLEEEKHAGTFNPARFELGTVYTTKKAEKKSAPDLSVHNEAKPDSFTQQDSLQRTRQIMLGIASENESDVKYGQKTQEVKRQVTQPRKEISQSYPEKVQTLKPEVTEEQLAPKLVKDMENERHQSKQEETAGKPPSPRRERRKQVQEKFGKVSDAPVFEFGTSYTKKEQISTTEEKSKEVSTSAVDNMVGILPVKGRQESTSVILTQKEKSPEPAPEVKRRHRPKATNEYDITKQQSLVSTSPTTIEKQKKHDGSLVKTKTETISKFDLKAQAVSAASGHNVEVPSSPREMSPLRVFAKTFDGASAVPASVSSTEIKPMKFEIKSSKTGTDVSKTETSIVKQQQVVKMKPEPNEEKELPKPLEKPPERQTSITSMEFKKPEAKVEKTTEKSVSVKTTEDKTEKTTEKSVSVKTSQTKIEKVVEKPKPERSEFTFESVSKSKVKSVPSSESKEETKKQELAPTSAPEISKRQEKVLLKSEDSEVVTNATETKQVDKDEKQSESLFEMHKKQVEEKLERKRESIHIEDKAHEKTEKPSEIFEYHKKQIAEFLDPRLVTTHVEDKGISKPEIDLIGKHEIDSQVIEMHRKAIEEKLEAKPEPIQIKEVENVQKHEKRRHKTDKPVLTKLRVEKSIVDTSLDDILSKNVDYLSDLEPPEFMRGHSNGRKDRPQSIHEHQKGKRILKKKSLSKRSKSEDRSHFKVRIYQLKVY